MTHAAAIDAARSRAQASGGAVWSLLLPRAERILCHAPAPTPWLHELARRGAHVDVVSQLDLATWLQGSFAPPYLRCLRTPDPSAHYDLAILWDPPAAAPVRAWLEELAQLPTQPREIALWTRNPWRRDVGPAWPVVDALLWRSGWRLGPVHLALPEADRVRQLVDWKDWSRTALVQHRRSHRPWKGWLARQAPARWMLPARLRRASPRRVACGPSAIKLILADVSLRFAGPVALERWLVSPNGVAIACLRLHGARGDQNAILKVPYVLAAEGRVAGNAAGLEWLDQHAGDLGRWGRSAPRLLARGRAGSWNYTLEETVEGHEAQSWTPRHAGEAMSELCGYLEALARLGEPARSLDAETLDRHIGAPIRRTAMLLERDLAQRLHAIEERLRSELAGVAVPMVPRHGDFKLENVLGEPGKPHSLRVLDWELWSPRGLPMLDLWHLLASRRGREAGCAMGRAVSDWLLPGALADEERELVHRLAAGLDPRFVEWSPLLYWLDRVGPIAARGSWPTPGWERANVAPVLEAFDAQRDPVRV